MAVCVNCTTLLPDGSHFCSHCGTPVPGRGEPSTPLTPQVQEIFDRLRDATAGRYEILSELGRGGMAIVFLGYQKSLDRQIAIKVLLPFLAFDKELVERFLREARTQGKLDHPSIIKVYEVYNEGGLTFFTMPYVGGPSLRTFLQQQERPPFATVHRYLCQAADALAYAHRRGVIHRDVKPDNMVIDAERDCVILTDFGIAKAMGAATTLTTPGDLLGTPQYMAPEQGEGKADLDGRADQYSLGLIGWEMLAGERPFEADSLAELMYKHRFEEPASLNQRCPEAPAPLRAAIMQAIHKEREDRFASMEQFLAVLESCGDLSGVADDRTEPMPRVIGEETTVRVATPPTGEPAAARPGAGAVIRPKTGDARSRPAAAEDLAARGKVAGVGPTARRPTGRKRLALAGLAVAATAIAGLVVLGPLDLPFGGGTTETLTSGGLVSPPPEAEGAGDAETSGGETAAGDTEGAGDPQPAEGTPTANVSGDPGTPVEAEPVDAAARARAARARDRAAAAAGSVRAAGLGGLFAAELSELDRRLRSAESELESGAFDRATNQFTQLVRDYTELAGSAAARQRETAVAALSQRFYAERLADLDQRLASAGAQVQASRLDAARSEYLALTADYQTLAGQANQAAKGEAVNAAQRVAGQRAEAVRRGAPSQASERFGSADALRAQAQQKLNAGQGSEALSLFEQAERSFAQLVSELPSAPPVSEEGGGPTATAEEQIAGLIERFRDLFQREELGRIRTELFRGEMPRQDSRILNFVFESADEINVTRTQTRNLTVRGASASAEVKFDMRFRQSRTREPRQQDIDFRMRFAQGPGGWRLEALGARR